MSNIYKFPEKKVDLVENSDEFTSGLIAKGCPADLAKEFKEICDEGNRNQKEVCKPFQLSLPEEITQEQLNGLFDEFDRIRCAYEALIKETNDLKIKQACAKFGYVDYL